MLGKLIKYEFKSTAIYFLPIYAALIFISGLNYAAGLLTRTHYNDFIGFTVINTILLYALLAIGLAVTTFVVIVIRFYKNLLGTEGYLMFTLPVTVEQNIFAKFFVAMVWFIGSCLLGLMTIGPVTGSNIFEFSGIKFFDFNYDAKNITIMILTVVFLVASLAISLLFIYFCMCVGQLFNSHKFIASVGTYFILNGTFETLSLVAIWIISIFDSKDAFTLLGFFCDTIENAPLIFAGCFDLAAIAFAVLLFFVDSLILKKKLNLT